MNTNLLLQYGFCEIPENVLFYRVDTDGNKVNTSDQLFFYTNFMNAFSSGTKIQIWKTKRKIKLLFLLRFIEKNSKGKSSLPDLYYQIYPNELNKKLDDLDIKQVINRRDPFAKELNYNFNIEGWFTSIEDTKTGFEICLFNPNSALEKNLIFIL